MGSSREVRGSPIARRSSGPQSGPSSGAPPAHVMWDGKDEAGLPLADGVYRYRLVVVDAVGRTTESRERTVEIMTSGPQGEVPVIVSESE